jgi:broad specificity phosphatase PhoE
VTDRLLLIRHARTDDTRRAAFPHTSGAATQEACPALDHVGVAQAVALRGALPAADRCWASFARRALETAAHAGCAVDVRLADLGECDFGAWSGQAPSDVDQSALAAWHADPDVAPHGGEGLAAVRARAAAVLERAAALGGTTLAFTHGGFVKATLLEVLGLPSTLVWRLDAAPGSVAELHRVGDAWRVTRVNWTPSLDSRVAVTSA